MATKPKGHSTRDVDTVEGIDQPIPKVYLRLLERFLLRPINNDRELEAAEAVADELFDRDLLPEEGQYLDVLCKLIEEYEDEHYPIADVSPARVLRFLIEQRGVTQQAAGRETGIANSTITALLKGDRQMTRKHIETFARYFGVPPAVFLSDDCQAAPRKKVRRPQGRNTRPRPARTAAKR